MSNRGRTGSVRMTRFEGGDFARLVLFGSGRGTRLAWHLTYRATEIAHYDAVVDADKRRDPLPPEPDQGRGGGRRFPEPPRSGGADHDRSRTAGLARRGRRCARWAVRACLLGPRRQRLAIAGRGRGHPAHERQLQVPVHPVQRADLQRRCPVLVECRRRRLVAGQPQAQRRPGLLPRQSLPRPPGAGPGHPLRRLRRRRRGARRDRRRRFHRPERRAPQQRQHVDAARGPAAADAAVPVSRRRLPHRQRRRLGGDRLARVRPRALEPPGHPRRRLRRAVERAGGSDGGGLERLVRARPARRRRA